MKTQLQIIITLILVTAFSIGGSAQNYKKLSDFPEHIKSTKPFKRFEWNYQQRAFPYDTIPLIYASRVAAREMKIIRQENDQSRNFLDWIPKGPSFADATNIWPDWDTVSGRVRALAIHPTDHLTVYIGAASGGLWKTTDGGESWLDIGHDLESITFGAIAIDPNNPETIYAGSGEAASFIANILFGGTCMYKSTDGGSTWDTINAFGEYMAFSDIVVSPFNSDVVFASLANGPFSLFGPYPNEGIWKSTDAGNSWVKTLDLPWAFDIALHPTDPDKLYACIGGRWTYNSGGIYISTDQGDTWNASNTGLPNPEIINRLQMDISQTHPDTMYTVIYLMADTLTNGEYTRAYKSINGGSSWFQISAGVPLGGYTGSYWHDQGWYDLCIAVDPTNSEHVFIGNIELHETTDGQNFSPVRHPGGTSYFQSIVHVDYHQLKFAPSNPDYFYIGCDGGIYRSTDGCNSAVSRNVGLETIQFYRMGSHPSNPEIMIAGTQDNGTMRTTDGGESWALVSGGDGMESFFDYENPDIVYSSQEYGRLMRSTNGGESFSLFKTMYGAWVTPFLIHPFGHDTLLSANDDIIKYDGFSFQFITNGLSPYLINTMAQSRGNPMHMILASSSHENGILTPDFPLMVSADGGYTWTEITTNIPGDIRWISRVVTHPYDENTMFIVRCGFSEGNKIYKTTDLGQNWENISGNLPDIPCNDLFIDPDNTQKIYVGTDLGVYLSEDAGASYVYAGGDMPYVPILDFDYVKIENTGYLRVATFGRGIYETTFLNPNTREKEILSQDVLLASPNPFTSELTLEYELQRSSNAQVNLYNQLGEKVLELVNELQAKGKYELKIVGHDLPAGVYFCTLKTDKGIQTKKIIKVE